MSFRLLVRETTKAEIASWNLDTEVIRGFYSRLVDAAESPTFPGKLVEVDDDLWEFKTSVQAAPDRFYVFVVRVSKVDESTYQVDQVSAFGAHAGKRAKTFWSSP